MKMLEQKIRIEFDSTEEFLDTRTELISLFRQLEETEDYSPYALYPMFDKLLSIMEET